MKFHIDTVYKCYDRSHDLIFNVCVTVCKQRVAMKRVHDKIMELEKKYFFSLRDNSIVLSVIDYVELGMLSEFDNWKLVCVIDDIVMNPTTDFNFILTRYAKIIDTANNS